MARMGSVHSAIPGRVLIALTLALSLRAPLGATTYHWVALVCPLDGTRFGDFVIGSNYVWRVTNTFREPGGSDFFIESLATCPTCGFTAHYRRFESHQGLEVEKTRAALAAMKTSRLFRKLDAAAAVERSWTNAPDTLAHLALAATWVADDTGEVEVVRTRKLRAIAALTRAWNESRKQEAVDTQKRDTEDKKDAEDDEARKTTNAYLVGELHRQLGNREQAVSWFERALASDVEQHRGSIRITIERQLFLAHHAGQAEHEILTAAREGSVGDTLAAIELLRGSTDPDVVGFLKQVCLTSDRNLRAERMDTLIGFDESWDLAPRRTHAPIFIEALDNDDFDTVARALEAIRSLRLTEAAPRILKEMTSSERSERLRRSRCMSALSAIATERDLAALEALDPDSRRGVVDEELLAALLRTKSERAIPAILNVIRRAAYPPSGEDLIPLVLAFGPRLVNELPDPDPDGSGDPLSIWKIRILGRAKSPESRIALEKMYAKGGPLAVEIGLALLRHGDGRGKEIILKDIVSIRYREELTFLAPFLQTDDFEPIYENMVAFREAERQRIEEERKERIERGDGPIENDPYWDYEQEDFLPLLGATRSKKAKPFLLGFLSEGTPMQLQEAALRGVAHVYDDDVAERLRSMLKEERTESSVIQGILRVIHGVGDKGQIDAVVSLVQDPTLIETKDVWTSVMRALAPDRAASFWESWLTSPSERLRETAAAAAADLRRR